MTNEEKQKEEDLFETGKFYLLNNRYDEALKIFEQLLKCCPDNPEVYYHIGLIKEAKNELIDAKNMFLEVLKRKPNHKLAKKHLNKLIGINDEGQNK
ncbi:MAG: tetratricopeptide repeat protein [Endomicrobia bacterium]|nr:tetratricopeptide repeat protein [Endomicrobiia bacterium]MCX7941234.1 tetratricopeptide repeat protein [Endomicrobiia bacterium]MDW8056072.1 tetratricopeptide repeat protein [Elusimicrobiota bacterium]